MMRCFIYIFLLSLCHCPINAAGLPNGIYRAVLSLHEGIELPFNFEVKTSGSVVTIDFINDKERIHADEVTLAGDSMFIKMPVFDSEIRARITNNGLAGLYINHNRKANNTIPFKAVHGLSYRFTEAKEKPAANLNGKWETFLSTGTTDSSMALGVFKQSGNHLSATFLTTTGDDRYLEGTVQGNKAMLSCFDGAHAFLFDLTIQPDGSLSGTYYSGSHWQEPLKAIHNEGYELPDVNSLTVLKPGNDKFGFSFPDLDSHMVSPDDARFAGKVKIIQIMGSWCPNCMDESAFLSGFYKKHKSKGVEIIALAYERTEIFREAKRKLERVKNRFDMQYPILVTGYNGTAGVEKSLPMIQKVISFPTTIIMDRKGKVRRIHTGYSGPATGKYYDKFVEEFTGFINKLEAEK